MSEFPYRLSLLVEAGAHLTGGNTRFCGKLSKCRNYAPFMGEVIKYKSFLDLAQMCHFRIITFQYCLENDLKKPFLKVQNLQYNFLN